MWLLTFQVFSLSQKMFKRQIESWYQIYGSDGKPYKNCSKDSFRVSENANVAEFKVMVMDRLRNLLPAGLLFHHIQVYKRVSSLEKEDWTIEIKNGEKHPVLSLQLDTLVSRIGLYVKSYETPLIVMVPIHGIISD